MAVNYKELARKTCDQTLKLSYKYYNEDPSNTPSLRWSRWDWHIGVAFYGVWKAYELLEDDSIANMLKAWIDTRIHDRIDSINVNTTAPMLTVLNLYEKYGENKYDQLFRLFDTYLAYFGLRTPCGALSHTVIGKHRPDQIWADTMFMAELYLLKRGKALGNEYYINEVIKQILFHKEYLVDKETNLLFHGWHDVEKRPMGVRWGRGNCWITASIVEMLETVGSDFPEKKDVLELINNQIEAISKLQREDGLWCTVLDHPETYPETSATAGFAFGILKGIRLGYVDKKYKPMAMKAMDAIASKIDAEGNVLGVSGGTPIYPTVEDYNNIPCDITPFGQGLVLMALCEAALHQ